ncbi:MAG: pyruvate oxidase, partial [Thalassospira sp.]|nr:pyruvate oxidase [Thalassospira sp.]
MKVADIAINLLSDLGVKHVFGIPGDAINDITFALENRDEIDFVLVRHEEGGAFAASAQAKLTGNLSCCVGTAGGGAIHLLNGLYDARHDHAP